MMIKKIKRYIIKQKLKIKFDVSLGTNTSVNLQCNFEFTNMTLLRRKPLFILLSVYEHIYLD